MKYPLLVWFRNDLRVHDNPALASAMAEGQVQAVYCWCADQWESHDLSEARKALTVNALKGLSQSLAELGVPLKILHTPKFTDVPVAFQQLLEEEGITSVYMNAEYALDERRRDRATRELCKTFDISWHPHHGTILQMPGILKTGQGQPYKVFTPFKKAWFANWSQGGRSLRPKPQPQGDPVKATEIDIQLSSLNLYDASLFPDTEDAALEQLGRFIDEQVNEYQDDRNIPAVEGTSRLSAALVVGLLSPIQCLHAATNANSGEMATGNDGITTWISELIWRDFYLNVIYSWPHVCRGRAFKEDTDKVAWRYDEGDFQKWCDGETGFPIVDAAMKQLNQTGWMHNRLRMVTAMFLTKYLLIDWRWGERYFMRKLIDGHFAANNGGWQWSASTGTDAAPYFRLLSPLRQAERFDPQGEFIKHFLPELKDVPPKVLMKPGDPLLLEAGYPAPMVDLKIAREACLAAFKALK
jgi:deoxyribodipyrimidine photo-lyase